MSVSFGMMFQADFTQLLSKFILVQNLEIPGIQPGHGIDLKCTKNFGPKRPKKFIEVKIVQVYGTFHNFM